ncbi:MAG: 50S ribosomal protein L25 [Candidatus Woesebacteria bacterium]|nr:50S ribosomal protein L25 [Candidatus Woesebacteria bacterium]
MEKITLKAKVRKEVGRKVKLLRKEGILPANIYGKKIKSESIQIDLKEFLDVYKKVGDTKLFYINERPVLVANIQKNPVSDALLHVDFHQVDLKEKVEAKVPVELTGESPAEKQSIGTVVQYLNEIEVEALPTDLPDKFEIDISKLTEVDQSIHVKDLPYDKSKIEVKTDLEEILVKVEPPQKEEIVAPPVAEVPAEGEVPVSEGEAAPEAEAGKEAPPAETPKEK